MKFNVSLMCMDFLDIKNQLEILNQKADYLHVDIMDGHYCKNLTLSPDLVKAFAKVVKIPMDCHLMTTEPNDWIEILVKNGAKIIAPHAEVINPYAFRTLAYIKELGAQAGIVLNPATGLDAIQYYIDRLDMITIMTVDVGFAGQAFIPEMLRKIENLANLKAKHNYEYLIQVDGGCNERTFKQLHNAGAEVLVVGSSGLFSLDSDLNLAYDKMIEMYNKAIA